jgi:hypothetical protein
LTTSAKGRIERFFGTAQDRLVKGLRLAGAQSLEEANTYLEKEYLPQWERDFTVVARSTRDAHRPLRKEHDLGAILSQVEERVVTHDYTIRHQGRIYQIGRSDVRAGLRGGRVRVEQRLDGSVAVRFGKQYLSVTECQPQPKAAKIAPPKPRGVKSSQSRAASSWMKGFDVSKSPPLWAIVESEKAGVQRGSG